MYLGKRSIVVDCDIHRVFQIAESYPTFVSVFLEGSKIVASSEDYLKVEVHSRLFLGFQTSWRGEGIKRRDRFIRFRQTQGLLKGLIARWSFVAAGGNRTRVTIMTRFTKFWLTPVGEKWFAKLVVEKITQKILEDLKATSELASSRVSQTSIASRSTN